MTARNVHGHVPGSWGSQSDASTTSASTSRPASICSVDEFFDAEMGNEDASGLPRSSLQAESIETCITASSGRSSDHKNPLDDLETRVSKVLVLWEQAGSTAPQGSVLSSTQDTTIFHSPIHAGGMGAVESQQSALARLDPRAYSSAISFSPYDSTRSILDKYKRNPLGHSCIDAPTSTCIARTDIANCNKLALPSTTQQRSVWSADSSDKEYQSFDRKSYAGTAIEYAARTLSHLSSITSSPPSIASRPYISKPIHVDSSALTSWENRGVRDKKIQNWRDMHPSNSEQCSSPTSRSGSAKSDSSATSKIYNAAKRQIQSMFSTMRSACDSQYDTFCKNAEPYASSFASGVGSLYSAARKNCSSYIDATAAHFESRFEATHNRAREVYSNISSYAQQASDWYSGKTADAIRGEPSFLSKVSAARSLLTSVVDRQGLAGGLIGLVRDPGRLRHTRRA